MTDKKLIGISAELLELKSLVETTAIRKNRIKIIGEIKENGRKKYLCVCSCGAKKTVLTHNYGRNTFSCGCGNKERMTKHGKRFTSEYRTWRNMINRCTNKNVDRYKNYGGRGLEVAKEWRKFENFYADMGDKPKGLTLDRINNNQGYSKVNCRWASQETQQNNKSTNHYETIGSETMTLSQWASRLGINYSTIRTRLQRGKSFIEAINGR